MILVFGMSSLMYASSSSSSSIAQKLVKDAASIKEYSHHTQLGAGQQIAPASPPYDDETEQEDEYSDKSEDELSLGDLTDNDVDDSHGLPAAQNAASTESSSSASEKIVATALVNLASTSSSSSGSSAATGFAASAQAAAPAISATTQALSYGREPASSEQLPARTQKNREVFEKSNSDMHKVTSKGRAIPRKCPHCGDEFRSLAVRDAHASGCSGQSSDTFKCCACGDDKFYSAKDRYKHQAVCNMLLRNNSSSSPLNNDSKIENDKKKAAAEPESSSSSSSSNSSSSGSMQPAKANAIAPTALFTSADNKAQQENEHNPASAQSSSARAIAEAHALAMRASSLSSSSNSSSSGSTHPVQAGVPNKKARTQRIQPDRARLENYNEEEANRKDKEYKKEAKKILKKHQDPERPSVKLFKCTHTKCTYEATNKGQIVEHIIRKHFLNDKGLFACLKCARFYYPKYARTRHDIGGCSESQTPSSSSNNSSSSGSAQPAQASMPAISTNNVATISAASLLSDEPGEVQIVGQAQSSRKRKDLLPHKQPSSKKQKIDQEEIQEHAQSFASSSSSSSAAAATTL